MEHMYTVVFLVGVIYTLVTFLLGGVFGIIHLGGHIDTHVDTKNIRIYVYSLTIKTYNHSFIHYCVWWSWNYGQLL